MTEMVCVARRAGSRRAAPGMYTPEQEAAWRRITGFVHEYTTAQVGLQLGHSGRKGSTKLMWEGIDEPLDEGNWEVCAPSPIPYLAGINQVPHELRSPRWTQIKEQFVGRHAGRRAGRVRPDRAALRARLSAVVVHLADHEPAHRPVRRLAGARLRYPLEVFAAMRAVWPEGKPMTVRISATDWVHGGSTGADAVQIASAFAGAGADAIDVSTGQVTPEEQPAFGRSYQTPFADAIRNQAGMATIAVGVDLVVRRRELADPAPAGPTCARSAGRTSTTRTGRCTRRRRRATTDRRRPGPTSGPRAAARRRPAGPTDPSHGSR